MRKKNGRKKQLPLVSVCTPTFNRRPFIPALMRSFARQDYPKDKLEWVIVDDGTDPIGDLVQDLPQVKYLRHESKLTLGRKRNLMHDACTGGIIVYMDDDDYYPPERVSHAVSMLLQHPRTMCAGSSEMHIYFGHIDAMYKFGPYGPRHATAATFAFRRELLKECRYDDDAALAEEKEFLKGYTVPLVQLEPRKTILVFSHAHNSFDKRKLLENPDPRFVKRSDRTVEDFVKDDDVRRFFTEDIDARLEAYAPGLPSLKPDVTEQMERMAEAREAASRHPAAANEPPGRITVRQEGKPPKELNDDEVLELLQGQHKKIAELSALLEDAYAELETLREKGAKAV